MRDFHSSPSGDILVIYVPIEEWHTQFIRKEWWKTCKILWRLVTHIRDKSILQLLWVDYYNLLPFVFSYGVKFPWISLLGCIRGCLGSSRRLSKYSHFIPLKHPFIACAIAAIFMKEVVRLHGVPDSILVDRDPLFVSFFLRSFSNCWGMRWRCPLLITLRQKQKLINCCLEAYVCCFVSNQPKSWSHWIPWAKLWYNTTFYISTRSTPFEVVYGRIGEMAFIRYNCFNIQRNRWISWHFPSFLCLYLFRNCIYWPITSLNVFFIIEEIGYYN